VHQVGLLIIAGLVSFHRHQTGIDDATWPTAWRRLC
jgi:hypothetical protein